MKLPTETTLVAMADAPRVALFRLHFRTSSGYRGGKIRVTAFRGMRVQLDGKAIYEESDEPEDWKRERQIALPDSMTVGQHTLVFTVQNSAGPPMAHARVVSEPPVSVDPWFGSGDGKTWGPVWPPSRIPPPELAREFHPASAYFWRTIVLLFPVILLIAAGSWYSPRLPAQFAKTIERMLEPRQLQWVLMALLLGLSVNDLARLHMTVGTDVTEHYRYIHHIAEHHELPAVTEGLQSFQAPLFYVLGAGAYRIFTAVTSPELADRLLRLLPILCGIGLLPITSSLSHKAFPDRADVQRLSLVLVASLPMLVYKMQTVTNEPLAGLLGAGTILMTTRLIDGRSIVSARYCSGLGLLWGLAVLAKVSGLVLAPVIALCFAWWIYAERPRPTTAVARAGILTAVFLLTCGWFFVRNELLYGKPFMGGWDPQIGYTWWQFPGYRTLAQYMSFGRALHYPLFAATASPWDGLYATLWSDSELSGVPNLLNQPKWNFTFMLGAVRWALVPTVALAVGFSRSLVGRMAPERAVSGDQAAATRVRLVCVFATGAYAAAVLAHTITLPYYNTAKSTYALAAAPALALLMAWGFEPLTRWKALCSLSWGWLAAWFVLVYATYFALAT